MNPFLIVALVFAAVGLGFSITDDEPKYAGVLFCVMVCTVLAATART
jgi:hypothetical protein